MYFSFVFVSLQYFYLLQGSLLVCEMGILPPIYWLRCDPEMTQRTIAVSHSLGILLLFILKSAFLSDSLFYLPSISRIVSKNVSGVVIKI